MIPTSMMGVGDLALREWIIIDLASLNNPDVFDRHMFGYCEETDVFQICSKILEETDQYCQTRSRKYFKDGPAAAKLNLDATGNLVDFLFYGWRLTIEQVREVVAQHSEYTISDEAKVEYQEIVTEEGVFFYAPKSYDRQTMEDFTKSARTKMVIDTFHNNEQFMGK